MWMGVSMLEMPQIDGDSGIQNARRKSSEKKEDALYFS